MADTDAKVRAIVTRVALAVALTVGLAPPIGYWLISYDDLSSGLEFKARVKATALATMIANSPREWMFAENRLLGLLAREPVPLETEAVEVFDESGATLAQVGAAPLAPILRRSYPLHDSGRVAGRVEVTDSLRPMLLAAAIATLLGMLLGGLVFYALRTFPLRALRGVTNRLFEQKQRAQVTLRSIGDGVITTDAAAHVDYLNPVAEQLSGWTSTEAQGHLIAEVVPMHEPTSDVAVETSMRAALSENRVVTLTHEVDLVRRDGTRVGVDDSAAPIHDATGAVVGGVLVIRDVSVARDFMRQRSWEAAHDVLTGLVNRREFEGLVDTVVATARNAGKHHVVCYMDLDRFKAVNDTGGHAAGDALLKQLSELMLSRIRASDTLARLGGDEFGLILEGCSLERAQFIAADVLAAVADFRLNWEGKVFAVGVSIGLATVTGDTASSAEALSMADTACYWAKEQGRNRVCVYRTGDSDMAARRRETGWIARIHRALAEDRFVLYQQSYLPLAAGAGDRDHLEVLLRMVGENGELIQPGSFLPAAERYNLMPTIDRWVIRTVFDNYHALAARRGGRPLTCAINLSGTSLNAEGFFDYVRAQALEHALPPQAICFEITETSAINNLRSVSDFIQECKAMGFLFALDDFGTGTSSFGYLRNLPVDYLKIDGGFVKNMAGDAIDRAMTDSINRIGHIMGIKTVAEFAESEAIIQQLKAMGVDYAQGFGVCLPTPLFDKPQDTAPPLLAANG